VAILFIYFFIFSSRVLRPGASDNRDRTLPSTSRLIPYFYYFWAIIMWK